MGRSSDDRATLLRAAITAVRDCADTIEAQATGLIHLLRTGAIREDLRASAVQLCAGLKDAAGRVAFELALLQAELGEGKVEIAAAVKRLSVMDSTMMNAVAPLADVVDRLETAAERDERFESAFVVVIEATGGCA